MKKIVNDCIDQLGCETYCWDVLDAIHYHSDCCMEISAIIHFSRSHFNSTKSLSLIFQLLNYPKK